MSDTSQGSSTSRQEQPLQNKKFQPKKPKRTWFIMLFTLTLLGAVIGIFGVLFNDDMAGVVKGQLDKLREDRITQAYYDYTSKSFQKTTSLEEFRIFLSLYKVLSENKSFTLEKSTRIDDKGKVSGVLVSNELHEMKVEFQLVKEDKKWKIESIRLKEPLQRDGQDSATQELADRVHEQLKALRRDEILDAYYDFLSKDFQRETPFQVFKEYVESNPILTSFKSLDFKERRIEDGMGYVDLSLSSDLGDFILESKLKRENDEWKVWSIRLILPPEEASKKMATDPNALVIPVKQLLNSLLQDNIEKAYHSTAREFQEATSLSSFENFVHTYPALTRRDLTDVKAGLIENGAGKLRVNLHDDEGMTVMEFKLGFDEGQWKIWGVKVVEGPERSVIDSQKDETKTLNHQSLAEKLIKVIHEQLTDLRHHDTASAYYTFSSQAFQDRVSFSQFENLIADQPVYSEARDTEFEKMTQQGKLITLKGTISTFDYKSYPVKYELVKEYGSWKINHFETGDLKDEIAMAEKPEAKTNEVDIRESEDIDVPTTDIKKITVGDEVDDKGFIKTPRVVIDSDINLLFFNVDIEDGEADSLVTAFLSHVDSGTTAPPLSTKLKRDGRTVVSFSYAAPTGGWPVGNYLIKVTTSTKDEHIQGFQMRKGERGFY